MFKHIKGPFSKKKKPAKKHPETLRYEELEQRVLFSADIAPGLDTLAVEEQVLVQDVTSDVQTEREAAQQTAAQTAAQARNELVLVNEDVADYEQLISNLQENDANRIMEVVVLDSERDGIEQVSDLLAERSDLSAVHVITHGSDGQINLGNTLLNSDTLQANGDAISSWGSALTDSGDILFYGCNIAADGDGQTLVGNIATLTGADVAASDDPTGHEDLGGDWDLEHHAGDIEAAVAPSAQLRASYREILAVINGTTGDDVLLGTAGSDVISADAGNDVLVAGGGSDQLLGDASDDVFRFTDAQDGDVYTVDGGTETDTIDLTEFGSGSVTDDGATIVVNLGESKSFTINYTNIENIVTADTAGNHGPQVEAGHNQVRWNDSTYTLEHAVGEDFDGDALTWSWTQIDGPAVTLSDPNTAHPSFTPPNLSTSTTLTFSVVVSDGMTSHADTVQVTLLPVTDGTFGVDTMTGTSDGELLAGGLGDDTIDAGDGDDIVMGGANTNTLSGGAGTDIVSYHDASTAVTVDLTLTTAQDTDFNIDTLSGFEGVQGSAYNDTFAFSNPVDGATYIVDGNAGSNKIDLSGFASTAASFGDGTLTVDMGGGQSFTIQYEVVDSIVFSDITAVVLSNDHSVSGWSGSGLFIDGDEAFTLSLTGGGTINWSYDRGSDTLSITSASGVGASSTLSITDLNGTDLRVDQIVLDADFGNLTTNTGVGSISLAGVGSDINGAFTIGGDLGSITMNTLNGTLDVLGDAGTITLAGDLLSGKQLTVTGDVGTLSVGGELDGHVYINGSVDTVDVTGKIGSGGILSIGADAGYIHASQDIVSSANVSITGNVTTFAADDRILGSVDIGGDVGTFELTGLRDGQSDITAGASVTIGGDVTTLTVQGNIKADVVTLLTVDGSVGMMTVTGGVLSDVTIGGDLDSASMSSVDNNVTVTANQVVDTLVFDVGGTDYGGTYAEAVYYVFDGASQTASATVPDITSDLALELLFPNASGTTAVDTSGNGNDGTFVGDVTRLDGTITVDYTDGEDYVEIPNSPTLENIQEGDYTIAATFTPNSTPPGSGTDNDANYGIIVKAGWHTGLYYTADNTFKFEHQLDGDQTVSSTSASTFPPGQSYHIVVTVDRYAGLISLYVDGELQDTSSFTPGTAAREYGTEPWQVGIAYPNASSWGWAADGAIDDVRMYSRALTEADAYTLANLTTTNVAPVITSDGGGDTAAINVAENTTAVTTVTATDADGDTRTFGILGGADAALFSIDANSGVLTFNTAPNVEAPADADGNNVYEVTVQVSDGRSGADTQAINVTVTAVNDNPTNEGSLPTDLVFLEDMQGKLNLSAIDLSDVDAGSGDLTLTITSNNGHLQTMGWPGLTLGGSQSQLILTGTLANLNAFLNDTNSIDYEHATPGASGDNVDLITIEITDNGNTGSGGGGTITLGTINIDIDPIAPQVDLDADDSTETGINFTTTWIQGGGQIKIADTDAVITDADSATLQALTVTLTNHLDGADERMVADAAGTAISVTYAVGPGEYYVYLSGADTVANYEQVLRSIEYDNTAASPDATARVVTVQASDGTHSSNVATTTINMVTTNTTPSITSNGGGDTANINVGENTTAVTTVTATDGDGDTPIYSISGGADAALFGIDANSGVLTFNSQPNFEAPADADGNNVYEVTVKVSDGKGGTDTQAISVTVTNAVELVVTNTNATGTGSLHEAILNANANTGVTDTITFNIPGSGPHVISLTGGLPTITDTVVIDGTTDSDYAGSPVIRIDGSAAGAGVNGLTFAADSGGSEVRGLMITGFSQHGIQVDSGADGITLTNNWIGTTGTGSTDVGNDNTGINIQGANTIVGGMGANDGNVITNNTNEGINITGTGATGTIIQGNIIGLDPDGSTGSGNADVGIALLSEAHNTTIGGTTVEARNVISNNYEGIEINSNNNVVQGNFIGTDITGALDRGNRSDDGVEIQNNATGNLIGGETTGAGNVIAFNALNGVNVVNGTNNSIVRNSIHSNTLLGINLGSGANNDQNFPVLTSAVTNGMQITVEGTLSSTANTSFRIEIYSNTTGDPTGYGEGQTLIGILDVGTDGFGNASFSSVLSASVSAGSAISATVSRLDGGDAETDSSEFAQNVIATAEANTAPVNTVPGVQVVLEDTPLAISGISVNDVDGNLSTVQLSVTNGTLNLTLSGTSTISAGANGTNNLTLSGSQADINATLASLIYQGNLNYVGADTLTVISTDSNSAADTDTVAITVNQDNDAPVVTASGGATAYTEQATATVIDGALTLVDPDGFDGATSSNQFTAVVRITGNYEIADILSFTNTAKIQGNLGGNTLNLSVIGGQTATVADFEAALRTVTFYNGSDTPSELNRTITFSFDDGVESSNLATKTLTFAAINDDPTNNGTLPSDVTVLEGVSSGVDLSSVDFGDLDHNNQLLTVTLTTSFGGRLFASTDMDVIVSGSGGPIMTLQGGLSNLNSFFNSATRIQYLHSNTNLAGDNADTIQVQIRDNGNTGTGGGGNIDLGTVNVDITNVNDAPAGTDKTVSTNEDTDYTFTATDFGFSDINDSPAHNLANIVIVTAPTNGTLYVDTNNDGVVDGGEALVSTNTVAVADITAGRLKFKPATDANGTGYDSFTFKVQDDGSTANSGVDTDPTANTITINVTPVNDPPDFSLTLDGTPAFTEDGPVVVLDSNVAIFDAELSAIDNFDGASLALVRNGGADSDDLYSATGTLSVLTEGGGLVVGGTAIGTVTTNSAGTLVLTFNANATNALVNSAKQQIAYSNSSDTPPASVQIDWTFDDGNTGAQGAGGAMQGTGNIVVNITAVDDTAPIQVTNTGSTVAEKGTDTISNSKLRYTDSEQPASSVTYTVTGGLANGQLELTTDPDTAVTTFTQEDIDNDRLVYIHDDSETTSDSFNFSVDDGQGNSISGQYFEITVTPVNDAAPVATDDTYSVDEDNTLTAGWWNTNWSHRQQLTFDNLAQAETLTDFPVLVILNSSNIDYTQTKDDGSDLRFFATDGTPLVYEIEKWNEGGDSSVWVRVPQITGNSNSDSIWMYSGNNAADPGQNAAGVWDSSFVGVWHLNEEQGGTGFAGVYQDSTFHGNTGIDRVAATGQDGQVTTGQEFGANDWIEIAHDASLDLRDSMTISFWIKPNSDSGTFNRVVEKGLWGYNNSYYFGGGNGTNDLTFYLNGQEVFDTPDNVLTVGEWQHAAVSYTSNGDGTGTARLYLNGVIDSGNYTNGAVPGNTGRLAIGHSDPSYDFDGFINEVQISNTDRSADWIAGQYRATKNQVGVEFVQFGGEESAPAVGGVLSNDTDVDGDPLTVTLVDGPDNAQSFTLNKDGTFIYTPIENYHGTDTFTYEVSDGNGGTNQATATITVNPVNDAPTAAHNTVTTNEDTAYTFTAADFNFSDIDGDNLASVKITSLETAGSLQLSGGDVNLNQVITKADIDGGNLTFSPAADANGTGYDSFDFSVNDGTTDSAPNYTMTVDVTAVNDAPILLTGSVNDLTVNEDSGLTSLGLGSVTYGPGGGSDESGQTLSYQVTTIPSPIKGDVFLSDGTTRVTIGAYTLAQIQGMQFKPADNASGTTAFQFNVYDSGGTANGGSDNISQFMLITITAVDDFPLINDLTTSVAEDAANTTVVTNINEANTGNDTDLDGQALTYTITAGNTDGIFAIDGATGEITVSDNTNLNYEATQQYILTVEATDETNSDTAAITIDVTDVVESATFTIDAIANTSVAENTAFTSVTPNLSGAAPVGTVTYTLAGADAALFSVDAGTGVVSMVARDFEAPADADTDNVYEVTLVATDDDGNTDSEDFTVTVTDQVEAAVFTIDAIGDTTVAENAIFTSVTPNLSGAAPIGTVTYSLTGTDAGLFTVDAGTGVVSMIARDYESPADTNADNVYEVTLVATDDDDNTDNEDFTVTVTDQVEAAVFTIDAIADTTVTENTAFASVTPNLSGAAPIGSVTYSLTGTDTGLFTVDSNTGVVSMVARDFESPADADTDNVYEVTLVATDDDGNTDSEDFTVTVTDQVEAAVFTIDAIADTTVAENAAFTSVKPNLSGAAPIGSVTYTLSGTDAGLFTVDANTGVVSMVARDYESPADANADNIYEVTLIATDDDGNTDSDDFTVTVTDANDNAPVIVGTTIGTVAEDGTLTASGTLTISDLDTSDNPISFLNEASTIGDNGYGSFELTGGTWSYTLNNTQAAVQALDAGETLTDTHTFTASDGSTRVVTITINGANDAPAAVDDAVSGNEDTVIGGNSLANDTDTEGDALAASLVSGPANGSLALNADGSFSYTPDADWSGTDSFTYTANDGVLDSNVATVTITVNPVEDTNPDGGGTATVPDPIFEDPETDEAEDPGGEAPTSEDPMEDSVIEDEQAPPVEKYLMSEDSVDADEQLVNMEDPEAEEAEKIIYLTDEIDTDTQSEERDDDSSYIYFDNDLYKELNYSKYLDFNGNAAENAPVAVSLDDFSILDLDSDDQNRVDVNSDYDLHRQEIDESFNTELRSQEVKAKIVTISAATFAAGVVSYLLRVGSMVSSLMSTLPIWRGFDPIAIFSGDKKRKKDRNDMQSANEPKSETLFDGEAE